MFGFRDLGFGALGRVRVYKGFGLQDVGFRVLESMGCSGFRI